MNFEVCAFRDLESYRESEDADSFEHFDRQDEAIAQSLKYADRLNADSTQHQFEVILTFYRRGADFVYTDPIHDGTHVNGTRITKRELLEEARLPF